MKKTFRNTMIAMAALLTGTAIASCSDANEYEDFDANNPSWVDGYHDSLKIAHPETLTAFRALSCMAASAGNAVTPKSMNSPGFIPSGVRS